MFVTETGTCRFNETVKKDRASSAFSYFILKISVQMNTQKKHKNDNVPCLRMRKWNIFRLLLQMFVRCTIQIYDCTSVPLELLSNRKKSQKYPMQFVFTDWTDSADSLWLLRDCSLCRTRSVIEKTYIKTWHCPQSPGGYTGSSHALHATGSSEDQTFYTTQRRIDYHWPHRHMQKPNQPNHGIILCLVCTRYAYNSYLHLRALKTRIISFLKHYKIVIFHTESTIYTNTEYLTRVKMYSSKRHTSYMFSKDHKTLW